MARRGECECVRVCVGGRVLPERTGALEAKNSEANFFFFSPARKDRLTERKN